MDDAAKRERLGIIEEDLERLRAAIPERTDGPMDAVDAAQELTAREELLGQIEQLEAERERLQDELG
ncbi:hypothetical protein [Actinomadura fibrosa]|uniref:Uncharacterized protein n=1 Tax=Actinomadura fibrosa TaxID=111802 RepID=A0ABW2XFU8_9ACTN|nr:hypothetical protein [Actinomadura fibrosa]